MPNPIEQLADAFKTEAMKSAWPKVSAIFKKAGIETKKYDNLFSKDANITVMGEAGNKLLLALSQSISDAVLKEFTEERAEEVLAQTQKITIKSTIREELDAARKAIETAGTKDLKIEARLVMAGLQSFYEQMQNIDATSVLKAKMSLEKDRAIEQGKKAQVTELSSRQSNQGRVALNEFATKAEKAPAGAIKGLALTAVGVLVKNGIKVEHLEGLFNMLEPFGANRPKAKAWRQLITDALSNA